MNSPQLHATAASWPRRSAAIWMVRLLLLALLGNLIFRSVDTSQLDELDDFSFAVTARAAAEKSSTELFPPVSVHPSKLNYVPLSQAHRDHLRTASKTWNIHQVFGYFPRPNRPDSVQVYNEGAHEELLHLLLRRGGEVILCANGGSATAGGGGTPLDERFYSVFAKHVQQLNPGVSIGVAERGHGTRGSLHSALLAPNILPPDAGVLFWEFSINDGALGDYDGAEARSALVAWLLEVKRMRPRPPLVVLVYLWRRPFQWNEFGRVDSPVYAAHAQLAKQFEFVVGHVNVASYLDEIGPGPGPDATPFQSLFVGDGIHPTAVGHLAAAYLLLTLLREEGRPRTQPAGIVEEAAMYDWTCGTDTEEKTFVRSKVMDESKASFGWRSPLATATLEQPRNDDTSPPGQLVFNAGPDSEDVAIHGKQDPGRKDRQVSVSLACCGTGKYTALTLAKGSMPLENVTALFLGFYPGLSDVGGLEVRLKSKARRIRLAEGRLIKAPRDWPCSWSWQGIYSTFWFDFEKAHNHISRMAICAKDERCSTPLPQEQRRLQQEPQLRQHPLSQQLSSLQHQTHLQQMSSLPQQPRLQGLSSLPQQPRQKGLSSLPQQPRLQTDEIAAPKGFQLMTVAVY